jgi:hypothetical protein
MIAESALHFAGIPFGASDAVDGLRMSPLHSHYRKFEEYCSSVFIDESDGSTVDHEVVSSSTLCVISPNDPVTEDLPVAIFLILYPLYYSSGCLHVCGAYFI